MTNHISELLDDDLHCEVLLEQAYGLNELERACFEILGETDDLLDVDEVADRVDRSHSTTYRTLQRLSDLGLVRREQVTIDGGGRSYVYGLGDPESVADELRRRLDDLHGELSAAADRFPDVCADQSGASAVGD